MQRLLTPGTRAFPPGWGVCLSASSPDIRTPLSHAGQSLRSSKPSRERQHAWGGRSHLLREIVHLLLENDVGIKQSPESLLGHRKTPRRRWRPRRLRHRRGKRRAARPRRVKPSEKPVSAPLVSVQPQCCLLGAEMRCAIAAPLDPLFGCLDAGKSCRFDSSLE